MAAPHPERELARVQQLGKHGLPPVVVLTGAGVWFRDRALDAVLAAVPAAAELRLVDGQQVDVRGLGAGEDEPDAAAAEAEAGPAETGSAGERTARCADLDLLAGGGLFSRSAFLVVRRAERWLRRHGAALAAFLPRIARGSGIVLSCGKLDKRTTLARALAGAGAMFEFRELYETPFGRPDRPQEGELAQWVMDQGRRLGVPLSAESALLLLAQVGRQPGELLAELARLPALLGSAHARAPLGPDDLRGKLTVGFESTPFELADAVLAHDRARAFRSLRAMFDRGVKQRDGRPMDQGGLFPFTVSWLFQSLAQLHEGRLLLDAGVRAGDVPGAVGVRGFVERYQSQLQRNDREQLERGLLWLLCCQREKRRTGEDDDVLLERFLARWFAASLPPAPEAGW